MDKRFGTIDADGKFSYAMDFIKIGRRILWNPRDEQRLIAGEREVVDEVPPAREGFDTKFDHAEKTPDKYRVVHGDPWTDEEGVEHEGDSWEELDEYGKIILHYRQDEIPTPPPSISAYDDAMEAYLKGVRCRRGYTTREPDSYLSSSVERWAQDARDWVEFKDRVMLYALGVENSVKKGGEIPDIAEFLEGMPRMQWTIQDDGSEEGAAE